MAAIIATAQNYWISTSALTITLNALGEANRVQASVASGAQIMCYIRGVDGLDFDEGHNYRRWPLTVSPTYFNTNTHKYLYVVIPRTTAIGTQAMVWFPSQLLDINGCAIDEEGESAEQVGNPDYYYIWLQGIISSSGASGNTPRTWEQQPQTGTLATDEAVSPTGGFWYQWDAISQTVTFLKDIWMDAASTFRNLILGGKTLTGVAVDATTPDDSTTHVATPAYVKSVSDDRYLRKDRDDTTPYSLTVEQELRVGNRGIMNHLQSTDYTGDGMLDSGYKLWYEEGRAKLVIDDLVARGKFTVNELETRIWTYAGGNMVFSGAGSTIFFVEYLDANENPLGYTYINQPWLLRGRALLAASLSWSKRRQIQRQLNETERAQVVKFRCYEFSDDGTMQTRNWWHTNDIAMCQTLNKVRDKVNADGSYSGYASNTVYKRRVAGIGSKEIPMLNDGRVYDYVDLWNVYDLAGSGCSYMGTDGQEHLITDQVKGFLNMAPSGSDPSTDWPAAGDVIVQMGNPLDTDRQAAVTIEVQGDVHGFKVYDTIADYSMENKLWVEIGYDQTTSKAKANVYGDFRFGCRESEEAQGGSYVKYNRTTKVLDIKAKINAQSTMPYNGSDTTLANIFSGLNQQIDGKVETWRQATDPASAWTTDDERLKHVGDLWMDISANGGKKTYIYQDIGASANPRFVWDQQDVPQAVFDGIDGKASVYDSWGVWGDKLHVRDLLIPTADITEGGVTYKAGKVYRCTQVTPSIVFTEVAYTDDTNFNGYIHALLNGSGASGDAATAAAAQRAVLRAVKGDTVVDGGLLLTSLIAMRQFNGSEGQESDPTKYTTWGGISGIYDDWSGSTHAKGHGIAAWFGGAMVDKEDVQTLPASYAKSLFRMDGSGYVADGGLSWDYNGQGKTVVTLNGDVVKAANYYLNGTDITATLNAILGMFEIQTINNVEWVHVKNNRPFYSDSDISAGGAASGGGGGGGDASALYELNDVTPNATHDGVYGAQDGYVLTYDASTTHWYAAPAAQTYVLPQATSGALGGIKIGFTTDSTNKNYAVVLDNNGKAYVNVPWSGGTQSDWNESDSSSLAYIKNKPTIPTPSSTNTGYAANADNAKNVVSLGNVTTTTSDDRSDYGIYTYNMYNSAGTAPQAYMSAIGFGYGVSKIEIAGSWGDDYTGNIYWRSKSDRDVSQYPWKAWKTIIDSGNIGSQSVNYATSAGNADTLDGYHASSFASSGHNHDGRYLYWGGYAADAVAMTWGTLTAANGYHILSHFSTSDGGDGGFAYKSGQIFMQIDGMFYQREGAYACIDTGGGQTIANNLQVASVKIEETNEINSYSGMLHLNYRVNTGVSLCNGGGNVGIGTTNPSYKLHVSGDVYATGDVTAASDERAKDVVSNVVLDINDIANAPAIKFTWKDKRDELTHVGSIAQYWQKILPESVSDKNDTLGLNYAAAAMVSVINVAKEVLTHEEEIEQLKKRVRELEHEVERLKIA